MYQIIQWFRNVILAVYKKGFFHLLSANYLAAFFVFVSQMLIAWWLTPTDIGRIKVLQSILSVVTIGGSMCFYTSIVKLCSENRPRGESRYLFIRACIYVLPTIVLGYVGVVMAAHFSLLSDDQFINRYAPLFMLCLLPAVYHDFFVGYLQSVKQFRLIAPVRVITKFFAILLTIALTYYFNLKGYVIGFVFGLFLIAICFFYVLMPYLKGKIIPVTHAFRKHFQYAKYMILTKGVTQISGVLDILVLNFFIGDRAMVGYYSFAAIFIAGFNIVISTYQQIAFPYLSDKSEKLEQVKLSVKKYSKPLYLVSTGCLISGLICVPLFLHFVFLGKYDRSIPFFYILFVSWFFQSIQGLKATAILGLGAFNWRLYLSLWNFCFLFVLTALFVKLFGVQGIAFGRLIVSFVSIFTVLYVYGKLTKVKE